MSTDYSKMSDTEIAQKVFFWLSNDFCPNGGLAHINKDGFFFFDNGNVKRKFDPCNNPADAWPIIVANLIEVSPDYDFTDESEQELHATGLWTAKHVEVDGKSYYQSHQNTLRAAMIVFLMMQEPKNAS